MAFINFIQNNNKVFTNFSKKQIQNINNKKSLQAKVVQIMKFIYDPEIKKTSLWELGLIYQINYININFVSIKMTLTSPTCPVSSIIIQEVKNKLIQYINKIKIVDIKLVFEPKWNKNMISEEIKIALDI